MIKRLLRILIPVAVILATPLIAMQFTDEVEWTGSDFVIMGVLLFIAGLLIDLAVRKARTTGKKIGLVLVILLGSLYIWAELAVGVFTNIGS